ncbi:hemolysin III family protein [Subsaximicrobium wynnwilliamsii]|uniref:Hemolysin III family protein n=1 Tax=Subsaximicrobium wynnwilliamsii TaxID=291179 RepID=A0A5C6ZM77_9FLAO|nr:hemolysin III family protein [Subsaximicrobium wynnwilliamsii]TXD84731.1 hemolysin III family protein [Subsaximicrobium wynnwilliamsii]TXD90401.1 hemolysin III family protein [Subsaximicrobium wynnwilliamsii]TXE04877.1 hemolysin III family protein [Subsaximicrobium wynnwilliamsii]
MRIQSDFEEKLNAWSHGIGAVLGIIGLFLLIVFLEKNVPFAMFSVVIYGLSIVVLFLASTFYHAVKGERRKHYFRIVDHISIYLLIAGTYTPVLLIMLPDSLGWTLFFVVWGIAAFGLILKIFFTGRFEIFSTLLYLVMGWLIVFDYPTLAARMTANGLALFFAGGAFYTIGIVFYAVHKIPYNHVIWHLFVLGGAICHFLMIYLYVI